MASGTATASAKAMPEQNGTVVPFRRLSRPHEECDPAHYWQEVAQSMARDYDAALKAAHAADQGADRMMLWLAVSWAVLAVSWLAWLVLWFMR